MIKTNMRRAGRKTLSGLLAMIMMFSILNITAFAAKGGPDIICGKNAHGHSDACWTTLVTEHEESAGHVHSDACGTSCATEHTHEDSCYACGQNAGDGVHTHDAACYEPCAIEVHTHTDACYGFEETGDKYAFFWVYDGNSWVDITDTLKVVRNGEIVSATDGLKVVHKGYSGGRDYIDLATLKAIFGDDIGESVEVAVRKVALRIDHGQDNTWYCDTEKGQAIPNEAAESAIPLSLADYVKDGAYYTYDIAFMPDNSVGFVDLPTESLAEAAKSDVAPRNTHPNIHVDLFNYSSAVAGHNSGSGLIFLNNHDLGSNFKDGNYTPSDTEILANPTMEKTLAADAYPTGKGGVDLSKLFDPNNLCTGTTKYSAAAGDGGLFADEGGYLVYDSARNAASYNTATNTFTVYNHTVAPSHLNRDGEAFTTPEAWGNFLPFNDSTKVNLTSVRSKNVMGEDVDNYLLTESTDLWFGMSMEGNFYMPKSGHLNGNDMVFEFEGDDDVFVYIDGVLVLDIGGIHGAMSGSINFATGEVVNPNNGSSVEGDTLYDIFTKAGADTSKFNAADDPATPDVDESEIFADYTSHDIRFFYLERGGNISHCMLKFNLPLVPKNSLTVEKEVADAPANDTTEYLFQILDENGDVVTGLSGMDANGVFKLSANEKAEYQFSVDSGSYAVRELIPVADAKKYDAVQVNSVTVAKDADTVTVGGVEYHAYTGPAQDISASAYFDFLNDYAQVYTVTYEYTGEVPVGAPALPAAADYNEGDSVTVANNPTFPGYTFSGWDKTDFIMPAEDVVIRGSWAKDPIPYTVVANYYTNDSATPDNGDTPVSIASVTNETSIPSEETVANTYKDGNTLYGGKTYAYTDIDYDDANKVFTLTYKRSVGSLKITKVTSGTDTPATAKFTVTGPNGFNEDVLFESFASDGTYTFTDLALGTYTVTEDSETAKADGYTLVVTGNGGTAEVTEGAVADITITNTYTADAPPTGSLKITKTTSGAATPADATFTVSGPNGYSTAVKFSEFNDAANGAHLITGLALGNYTVTESGAEITGYTLAVTGNENAATVEKDATATVAITNTYTLKDASYKVIHIYNHNGSEEYRTESQLITGKHGDLVKSADIAEVPAPGNGNTYTFQTRSADITLDADAVKTITLTYNRTSGSVTPVTYTLTVNYVDTEGNALEPATVTANMAYGTPYSTVQKAFTGYTFVETTGDAVSGIMDGSKVVTYIYEPDEIIEELDPPLSGGDEEILDEEPPLADVPETGDLGALWYGLTALSACGLAGLAITGKKSGKREDEE